MHRFRSKLDICYVCGDGAFSPLIGLRMSRGWASNLIYIGMGNYVFVLRFDKVKI